VIGDCRRGSTGTLRESGILEIGEFPSKAASVIAVTIEISMVVGGTAVVVRGDVGGCHDRSSQHGQVAVEIVLCQEVPRAKLSDRSTA
jgi:hypothetical protein